MMHGKLQQLHLSQAAKFQKLKLHAHACKHITLTHKFTQHDHSHSVSKSAAITEIVNCLLVWTVGCDIQYPKQMHNMSLQKPGNKPIIKKTTDQIYKCYRECHKKMSSVAEKHRKAYQLHSYVSFIHTKGGATNQGILYKVEKA